MRTSGSTLTDYGFAAREFVFGFVIMSKSSVRNGVTGSPSAE